MQAALIYSSKPMTPSTFAAGELALTATKRFSFQGEAIAMSNNLEKQAHYGRPRSVILN